MQIEFYSQFDILFSTCSILVFPRFSNHRRTFQTIQKIQLKEQKKSQRKKEKKEEKYGLFERRTWQKLARSQEIATPTKDQESSGWSEQLSVLFLVQVEIESKRG